MPTVATPTKISAFPAQGKLLFPVPESDFGEFLEEVVQLVDFAPQILKEIEMDLDALAREKKSQRLEDQKFFESQTRELPALGIAQKQVDAGDLKLEAGRPRMPALAVYLFLLLRGFLGSLSSKPARRFLQESMSLHGLLESWGMELPGITTILENVNAVSHRSRELIFDKQIELACQDKLDDFEELTIDSTATEANSSWPTDGKILIGLLERAHRLGQKLEPFGLKNFRLGWVPRWLEEMGKLEFQICLVAGKAKSRGKLKKNYRKLLKRGRKAAEELKKQLEALKETLNLETLPPSRRKILERILERIRCDVSDAQRVAGYCEKRVFEGQSLPSTEKLLSLSDGSAAYIKKGSREPVIGYKPQLVRSKGGFVTSLLVPEGNAADAIKLEPAIRESIRRTGVIAQVVSTDDGYASAKGRNAVLEMGVQIVSISGAKGKKLTQEDDWESEVYRQARRNRSAVESLMFTIKDGFEFGDLGRRGIDAVRDELLEKVLAYNCTRASLLKKRRRDQASKQAA